MRAAHIRGHQAVIGEGQGFIGLPVRWGNLPGLMPDGSDADIMQTEWSFTPEEREHIANGGNVMLTIVGKTHPPVLMHVVEPGLVSPVMDTQPNHGTPRSPLQAGLDAFMADFDERRMSGDMSVEELQAHVSMLARVLRDRL